MIKRSAKWFMMMLATITLLVGCSTASDDVEQGQEADVTEGNITIIVSEEEADEVYSEEEVTIEEDAILMDVMKENYEIEEDDGFITAIDGISPEKDEQKAWIYSVNDEEALVGAAEYELSIEDEVVFDLQSWE